MKLSSIASWLVTALAVAIPGAVPVVEGASITWTNAESGWWSAATNWNPAGPPNQSNLYTVFITNAATKTVSIDAVTAATNLNIRSVLVSAPDGFTNTLSLADSGTNNPLTTTVAFTIDRGGALQLSNAAITASGTFDISAGTATVDNGVIECGTVTARIGRVAGNAGTLTLKGGTLHPFKLNVGALNGATGILQVSGGTLDVASVLSIGEAVGSIGYASLTAGQIIVTNDLTKVGNVGAGTFDISGGTAMLKFLSVGDNMPGTLNMSGGDLVVTPRNEADWTRIGNLGNGTFNMSGGTVQLKGEFHLADDIGASGIMTMTGGELIATGGLMAIGRYGAGTMTVSNASVMATNVSVGRHAGATGLLVLQNGGSVQAGEDVSIGRFTNAVGQAVVDGGWLALTNDSLWVGREGIGTLLVSNGLVRARSLFVGMSPDGTNTPSGTAVFVGGTTLVTSNLTVGSSLFSTGQVSVLGGALVVTNRTGTARLNLAEGFLAVTSGAVTADTVHLTNSGGLLTLNGGTFSARSLTAATGVTIVVGDGVNPATLEMRGGTFNFANGLVISPNATLRGCGILVGSVTNNGSVIADCPGQALYLPASLVNTGTIESLNGGIIPPAIAAITRVGSTATIFFTTLNSSNYMVEYKDALTNASWTELPPTVTGTGGITSKADAAAAVGSRFYRVKLQ